jgi:uncharacterized protein YuzE
MQLKYDSKLNIAYMRFHEKKAQVNTIRVSEEMNVDIAPDGTVYGIELLNANEQLRVEDDGNLVVIDEAAGQSRAMPLVAHEKSTKYKTVRKRER